MNLFKTAVYIVVILAVIIAFFVYPSLPNRVPIHWGIDGSPDNHGPAWIGAFLLPLLMAIVLLILIVVPKIAIFKKNMAKFEKQYWQLGYALMLFFMLVYALTLLPNFGYNFNMSQLITMPMAMLFISIGVLMPSFKRNFFVGIRTPWTLANDTVWEETHKFGGKAFILAGFAMFLVVPFPPVTIGIGVGAVIVAALASVVYSYLSFRKHGKLKL